MKTGKPDNAPWVSPYIIVDDADRSIDFYKKAYGFEVHEKVPGQNGKTQHAELSYKGQLIMLGAGSPVKPPALTGVESPIALYFYTENVDEFYKHAVAAGAKSTGAPEDMFWGDRMCRLRDPDGFEWCFATFSGVRK